MKNERGKVLYVGKSKMLRNRVRSYFHSPDNLDQKTRMLAGKVETVDYIATDNEIEALILECNLIKEYRPKYNIRLKDDKRYPYLKLTTCEKFPRIRFVRKVENDGSEYFGPYTDVAAVRRALKLIKSIFPLRDCTGNVFRKNRPRECLNYQIGRCSGPCTGNVNYEDYSETVRQVSLFLKGRNKSLHKLLEKKMRSLSKEQRFEEASVVRDQIIAIGKISEKQHAVEVGGADEDIVALAIEGNAACGVVMKVREGKILGSESFLIPDKGNAVNTKALTSFLQLYYHSATDIPQRIYLQEQPEDLEILQKWLSKKTGCQVSIKIPKKGYRKRLIKLAGKNAAMKLISKKGRKSEVFELLGEVKKTLGLPNTPFRIEAYDISNIQGAQAVGSMVTFENGKPDKSGYRHFRIRDVAGADDCSMIQEVLQRRLKILNTGKSRRPDLILVDGGRGQVSSAINAMFDAGISEIPIIGLAKKNEEIYMAGHNNVICLSRRSSVLRLFQRMRDEAHRFAVEYHRKLRRKGLRKSELDGIEGIGKKRKMTLMVRFGSIESIRNASAEEIETVPGIGRKIGQKIYKYLHKKG